MVLSYHQVSFQSVIDIKTISIFLTGRERDQVLYFHCGALVPDQRQVGWPEYMMADTTPLNKQGRSQTLSVHLLVSVFVYEGCYGHFLGDISDVSRGRQIFKHNYTKSGRGFLEPVYWFCYCFYDPIWRQSDLICYIVCT